MFLVPQGEFYVQNRLSDAHVMDVWSGSQNDGTQIISYACNEQINQRWIIERIGNDSFALKAAGSGLWLEIRNGNVVQGVRAESADQVFRLSKGWMNGVFVISVKSGLALTFSPDGGGLTATPVNGSVNQSCYFAPAVPTSLVITQVRCEMPAGGTFVAGAWNDVGNWISNVGGALGGAAGVATGVAALLTKNSRAITVLNASGLVLGAVGLPLAAFSVGQAIDSVASSTDNLFISLDDNKIWPSKAEYRNIKGGETENLDLVVPGTWTDKRKLGFWEWDKGGLFGLLASNNPHDKLAEFTLNPRLALWDSPFTCVFANPDEKSVYSVSFLLTWPLEGASKPA